MQSHHDFDQPVFLHELLTTEEAARALQLSHDRVYRLLEQQQLGGIRIANRWLVRPADLATFRERRYGQVAGLCKNALAEPSIRLTEKQRSICETLQHGGSITTAARSLNLPRPSIYAQLSLVRKKLARIRPEFAETNPTSRHPSPSPS